MTQADDRVERVRKLLAKAEAKGTTPEEAETLSAKAAELMARYMIDDAMLASVDRLVQEKIVTRVVLPPRVPSTYAHEYISIGIHVAEAFGARGLFQSAYNPKTRKFDKALFVCGYESDVERIITLWYSLVTQCILRVGPFIARSTKEWHTGTDKYHMRRGFISGFGVGVAERLRAVVQDAKETSESQALVLVDRVTQVNRWVDENIKIGSGRPRMYDVGARAAGFSAGMSSDTGTTRLGTARKEIGQ